MANNTVIRDLIASGRKIVDIIPATPMTDTEIHLENGYSIQCNREEGMGLWRKNNDGMYTSFLYDNGFIGFDIDHGYFVKGGDHQCQRTN